MSSKKPRRDPGLFCLPAKHTIKTRKQALSIFRTPTTGETLFLDLSLYRQNPESQRRFMKTLFSRVLLCVLVVSQIGFGQTSVQSRQQRVEAGLMPPVLIKGAPAWTIQERM